MRPDKNTVYIITETTECHLDRETLKLVEKDTNKVIDKIPLMYIDGIILQGYISISTNLMYKCIENSIEITFMSKSGNFLGRVQGEQVGNVDLRKKQYEYITNLEKRMQIAKKIIKGKISNQSSVIERALRSYEYSNQTIYELNIKIFNLAKIYDKCTLASSIEQLRGYEGEASKEYFSIFNELIVKQKDKFKFNNRSQRPPTDNVNSMLSYLYVILTHEINSAINAVGMEPYAGFIHSDRSGRESLALDMIEELRPIMVDRTVLKLINKNMIHYNHFEYTKESVLLNQTGKKIVLKEWNDKKQSKITHKFFNEKTTWGMIPYYQANIMAKTLRGQIPEYIPYDWK